MVFLTPCALFAESPLKSLATKPIELPAVTVSEYVRLLPPEAWRYAQVRDLEVLSNARDSETTEFVRNFWRFRSYFQELFPRSKHLASQPVALVLRAHGHFAWQEDSAVFNAADADQGVFVVDPTSEEGASELQQRYATWVFDQMAPKPPAWFVAGMGQLCARLEFSQTEFRFTKLDASLGDYFYYVGPSGKEGVTIAPLGRLFVETPGPDVHSLDPQIFSNQSFAFIHLCLYSRGGKLQQPFAEFVRRASLEPVTEKLFQEIFHRSYNAMGASIRGHVTDVKYTGEPTKLPAAVESVAFELREATEAEVGRIKGDACRLAGQPGDARLELLSPYLRGHSDPRLLASLGFLNQAEKNETEAAKYFSRAVAERVELPGPYFYLAQMRLTELTKPDAELLTPAQAGKLFDLLGAAGALKPARADVYRLIAEVWLHTATTPQPENLAVFNDAVRAFPRDNEFLYAAACVRLRAGQKAEAAALVNLGLRFAANDEMKTRFEALKSHAVR